MNTYITHDFTKLSAFEHFSLLGEIAGPLRHLKIDLFTYLEHHPDDSIQWFTNSEKFIAPWQDQYKLYLTQHPCISKLTDSPGWFLWEPYFHLDDFSGAVQTARDCGMQAGISYVEFENGIKKSYGFASTEPTAFYFQVFQARHNLIQFIHYFKNEIKSINYRATRFQLPTDVIQYNNSYYDDEYMNNFQTNQSLFLEEINGNDNYVEIFSDRFSLTKRERQCLSLLLKSNSAKMIAYQLQMSTRTAEKHIQNIRKKTHCQSITDLLIKIQKELTKL